MSPSGVQYIYLSFGRKGKRERASDISEVGGETRDRSGRDSGRGVCVCHLRSAVLRGTR